MTGGLVIGALILWVLPIWVGHQIGKPKGRAGGLWGLFLGWIGVVVVALLPPGERAQVGPPASLSPTGVAGPMYRECPHCKEHMRRDASVCPHCRLESAPWKLHEGVWWTQSPEGEWRWLNERSREWVRFDSPEPSASTT